MKNHYNVYRNDGVQHFKRFIYNFYNEKLLIFGNNLIYYVSHLGLRTFFASIFFTLVLVVINCLLTVFQKFKSNFKTKFESISFARRWIPS